MSAEIPEMLTTKQVAKLLNRSSQTVRLWACKPEKAPNGLHPVRLKKGGPLLWKKSDVESLTGPVLIRNNNMEGEKEPEKTQGVFKPIDVKNQDARYPQAQFNHLQEIQSFHKETLMHVLFNIFNTSDSIENNFIEGIYFLTRGKKIVYVGSSNNIRTRVSAHRVERDRNEDYNWDKAFFMELDSDRLAAEAAFISLLKPEFNSNFPVSRSGRKLWFEKEKKYVSPEYLAGKILCNMIAKGIGWR
jgi:hypothetical protein